MINVIVVYDDDETKELVKNSPSIKTPTIEFVDMNTIDGRKRGFKLKGAYGARTNPFVIIEDGESVIQCMYSEEDWKDNAVEQLLKWFEND